MRPLAEALTEQIPSRLIDEVFSVCKGCNAFQERLELHVDRVYDVRTVDAKLATSIRRPIILRSNLMVTDVVLYVRV
jgi:hypothetical protein